MSLQNLHVEELDINQPVERLRFIKVPWTFYYRDPNWVPHLLMERKEIFDPQKNPTFEHMDATLFLALADVDPAQPPTVAAGAPLPVKGSGPQIVGRVAAIINHRHNEFHNEKVGFFGFFESVDDQAVADALLQKAGDWAAARGMTAVIGPNNFNTNDECAMLVEGFDGPPVFLMPYNPPYYPILLEKAGFSKAKDLYAWYIDASAVGNKVSGLPKQLGRVVEKVRKRGNVRVRKPNMKDWHNELRRFKDIYNEAWELNWGFIPLTDKELDHEADGLKMLIDPDLVFFAEVKDEADNWKPVGASITLPDYNQVFIHLKGTEPLPLLLPKLLWHKRKINRGRVFAMGVMSAYRQKGLDALMYYETAKEMLRKNYQDAEMGWTLEDNTIVNRGIKLFGAKLYRRYRFYERPVG